MEIIPLRLSCYFALLVKNLGSDSWWLLDMAARFRCSGLYGEAVPELLLYYLLMVSRISFETLDADLTNCIVESHFLMS